MAQLKPVQGVARIAVRGMANGRPIVNVFHMRKYTVPGGTSLPWTQSEMTTLAGFVNTQFKAKFESLLNTAYVGDTITAIDLTSQTGYEGSATNTTSGSGAGAQVPQSACACITWKIARHYRGGHPRTSLGPRPRAGLS